jgi:hypothetical protein
MTNFKIRVSGSGTLQEIIDGLERLAVELKENLDDVYFNGLTLEDDTLMTNVTENNDIETKG